MSSTNHHFLAILPLFAILSISPMKLDSQLASRSIASEIVEGQPKYEARAAKVDRTKITIDKDLDLNCYNDREQALRKRIIKARDESKADVDSLVSAVVELEEDMKVLKEKKAFPEGDDKADVAMKDFKVLIEGMIEDDKKTEAVAVKPAERAAEEARPAKEEVAKEEPKKDAILCELEEKNSVLTKQVEELLEQNKSIMQTMLAMTTMMVQMNQQQQQPQLLPQWMTSGSMMNYGQQYPTANFGNGQWIYFPTSNMPMVMGNQPSAGPNVQTTVPQLGAHSYQQAAQNPAFSYMPQAQPYVAPTFSMIPANFGSGPMSLAQTGTGFNFGS